MAHKMKSTPLVGVKAGPDDGLADGEFIAYAATFTRTPDSYGDVIAKGAFADSIAAWKASGDVLPVMYLHDPNQIVGGVIDMWEDEHGFAVKGVFDDDPASQKVYRLTKGRRLSALSFAYDILQAAPVKTDDGVDAYELQKLMVHEVSLLPKGFAANADTSVVAVKGTKDLVAQVDELKARVEDLEAQVSGTKSVGDSQGQANEANATDVEEPDTVKTEARPQSSAEAVLAVLQIEEMEYLS